MAVESRDGLYDACACIHTTHRPSFYVSASFMGAKAEPGVAIIEDNPDDKGPNNFVRARIQVRCHLAAVALQFFHMVSKKNIFHNGII